jgi:hypothetical protein
MNTTITHFQQLLDTAQTAHSNELSHQLNHQLNEFAEEKKVLLKANAEREAEHAEEKRLLLKANAEREAEHRALLDKSQDAMAQMRQQLESVSQQFTV